MVYEVHETRSWHPSSILLEEILETFRNQDCWPSGDIGGPESKTPATNLVYVAEALEPPNNGELITPGIFCSLQLINPRLTH